MTTETNGTDDGFDGDPNWDGKMEKIVHSEEELDDERDVFSLKLLLAGRSKVGERNLHVDVITGLILEKRGRWKSRSKPNFERTETVSIPHPQDSFPLH